MKSLNKFVLAVALAFFLLAVPAVAQTTLPPSVQEYFALTPSTYVQARALAASTAESIVVPTVARYVLFAATGDFYANYTTTATVPGDTTDGSASELNPRMRKVNGGQTISVIAPVTTVITAAFWN